MLTGMGKFKYMYNLTPWRGGLVFCMKSVRKRGGGGGGGCLAPV